MRDSAHALLGCTTGIQVTHFTYIVYLAASLRCSKLRGALRFNIIAFEAVKEPLT